MSVQIPQIDLTNAVVGTPGSIPLSNVSNTGSSFYASSNQYGTLQIFNDSGAGLRLKCQRSSYTTDLPAGGWRNIPIAPGETGVDYKVAYLLPNPPVSLVLPTYYGPGEPVPDIGTLGNSPVGIGGSVQTSSVQTLSNEGNAANTLVIDIGDAAISQLIRIFTDHFNLAVDVGGVRHTVLTGSTSGSPGQLGQAGDTTEVLGSLTVDQTSAHTGAATFSAAVTIIGALLANLPSFATFNGSTSGTATMYQPIQGTGLKLLYIAQNNYRNAGVSHNQALPTAFTGPCLALTSDIAGIAFLAGGSAVAVTDITALATGGGTGSTASPAQINGFCIAGTPAWDTLQFTGNNGSAHTGALLMIGV